MQQRPSEATRLSKTAGGTAGSWLTIRRYTAGKQAGRRERGRCCSIAHRSLALKRIHLILAHLDAHIHTPNSLQLSRGQGERTRPTPATAPSTISIPSINPAPLLASLCRRSWRPIRTLCLLPLPKAKWPRQIPTTHSWITQHPDTTVEVSKLL